MGYRSTPQDTRRAYLIGTIYVVLAIVLGWMLFKIWPPVPWPAPKNADDTKKLIAYLADTGCPESTPTPTATPTPTPTPNAAAAPAANTQIPAPTRTNPTRTGTQPTTQPAGTQPTGQGGTTAGGAQPSGPANNNQPITTKPEAQPDAVDTAKNGVVVDRSGQIISMPIYFFGQCRKTTFDERLLLLVIVVGILGAFVHGATSLADYIGNNNFNSSWTWFYFLRPAIGMSLALVFYFVIRGGFLSTTGGAADINPYGIAALAGLVGMFSKQATDKLSEVFGTLFRSAPGEGDAKRQDPLKPKPGPITVTPPSVVAGSDGFKLTVSGTGFVDGAKINVNDAAQTTTFESATTLSAQIPKETIANPAILKITVVNPDGTTTFGPADLAVSASGGVPPPAEGSPPLGGAPAAETPVAGEDTGDAELIDGCDVDMKADTPDEDLPITKGGVD